MRRLALTLFAALALHGAGAVPFAAAAPAVPLDRASAAWRAWVREFRPDLCAREGVRWPEHPAPLGPAELERSREALAAVRATLARVDRAALRDARAATHDSLAARAAREWAVFERDDWRRDPGAYAALTLEAALEAAATGARVSSCERTRRATQRLRAVPEALRAAQVNLAGAGGSDHAAALARWDDAIRRARTELVATFLACKDPSRVADAIEADSAAIAAARRFTRFVREDLVHSARAR